MYFEAIIHFDYDPQFYKETQKLPTLLYVLFLKNSRIQNLLICANYRTIEKKYKN